MPSKNQFGIYNDDELSLIKNTFAENDTLLYTIRKVMLQRPITNVERGLLDTLTPEVINVIKKRMLPEISMDVPFGQIGSLASTLTEKLKVLTPNEMYPYFQAYLLEKEYLQQRFDILSGKTVDNELKLDEYVEIKGKDSTDAFVHMNVYLFILGYVDPMLNMIKSIAGEKNETLEKQVERLKRNSNK